MTAAGIGGDRRSPSRVIGVGASAGGVDVLIKLVASLPPGLPHAICIVLHVPSTSQSMLGTILSRHTALTVVTPDGPRRLAAGHVFIAPPDRHLLVRDGEVVLTRGPKENSVRPAVDPMLRSLAAAYGPASAAVILSGALRDGASGALAVAQAGGTVIVQDPADAVVTSMPEHALAAVGQPARVLPAVEIGPALAALPGTAAETRDDVHVAAGGGE